MPRKEVMCEMVFLLNIEILFYIANVLESFGGE